VDKNIVAINAINIIALADLLYPTARCDDSVARSVQQTVSVHAPVAKHD
jgi:hypothetical protein